MQNNIPGYLVFVGPLARRIARINKNREMATERLRIDVTPTARAWLAARGKEMGGVGPAVVMRLLVEEAARGRLADLASEARAARDVTE